MKKLIDVYLYRYSGKDVEFLLLKRARGKIYQHQWRMIGGKVEDGETYWQAALRELKEETNIEPLKFWTLPGVNSFYEHTTDTVYHIPAFAVHVDSSAEPKLDDEHTEFAWFRVEKAIEKIRWPEQRRLIKLTHTIVTSDQILDDWLVSTS
jgi:dihydroneopterin triphosphate diphosphatase